MINLQLSAAFVAWAATTFLAHFSVKQILTTVAPVGFEVTSTSITVTVVFTGFYVTFKGCNKRNKAG